MESGQVPQTQQVTHCVGVSDCISSSCSTVTLMKCLDLHADDISDQLTLENYFIGNWGREASFYCLIKRGSIILLGILGRLLDLLKLLSKTILAVSYSFIYGLCSSWSAGRLHQVILWISILLPLQLHL